MVLNDLFDLEHDRANGSKRPLVTGKVSLRVARSIGYGALSLGIITALLAVFFQGMMFDVTSVSFPAALIAVAVLSESIALYDRFSKRTIFAPLLMGLCRVFNVVVGMVCAGWLSGGEDLGLKTADVFLLVGILMYISGITWYASKETESGNRWRLAVGTSSIIVSYFFWAVIPWIPDSVARIGNQTVADKNWFWLLAVFLMPAFVRLVRGIIDPTPRKIQTAVILCLFSIIALDGLFCWLINNSQPAYCVIVFLMLVPTLALSRLARPT